MSDSSRASAPLSPSRAAERSAAASGMTGDATPTRSRGNAYRQVQTIPSRTRVAERSEAERRSLELGVAGVDDLGDAGDAVAQDALDAGLEGHRRRRAAHARPDELDGHDAGLLVDVVQLDVAAVRLDGGADHLDRLLDLLSHGPSLSHSVCTVPNPTGD